MVNVWFVWLGEEERTDEEEEKEEETVSVVADPLHSSTLRHVQFLSRVPLRHVYSQRVDKAIVARDRKLQSGRLYN